MNGEKNNLDEPFDANDPPMPSDAYSQSKYETEQKLLELSVKSNLEVVIIRPPLIYGPHVKGNFKMMLTWLKKGLPIPVGTVENKRSLVGLGNLTDFIKLCLSHPKAANETFLVSDGNDMSTVELIKSIAECMNKSARLIYLPTPLLSCLLNVLGKKSLVDKLYGTLQVSIKKNEALLGWMPKYAFQEMLNETVHAYLRQEPKMSFQGFNLTQRGRYPF